MKKPLLSVCLITYNHANYIEQAIEGVLMQSVNFPWELIIADDFSTDGTREILLKYKEKYPNFIKLILQEKNVGPGKNFSDLLNEPQSKYIAYFEGDDYWIDPLKLQKQVDFIESHPDYVLIHSDVFIKNSDGEYIKSLRIIFSKIIRRFYSTNVVKQLIKGNYIMSVTVLMAKSALFDALKEITENENQIATIDYTLFLELSKLGKIHYQQEKTAVYRILPNSESNIINIDSRLRFIETTINISRFYNQKFSVGISKLYFDRVQLSAQLFELAKRGLVTKFLSTFYKGIKSDKLNILRLKNYYYFIVLIVSKIK
jgi:glycosyltransferase involved in cell wall biosynthesis